MIVIHHSSYTHDIIRHHRTASVRAIIAGDVMGQNPICKNHQARWMFISWKNSWMVDFMERSQSNSWMMTGATPQFRKAPHDRSSKGASPRVPTFNRLWMRNPAPVGWAKSPSDPMILEVFYCSCQ